ncbi:MAG: tyrosinase family protein, partial [Chloroflexota bacterium]|nr:tyrosinase family protein [Chloroflexota bacterium]
MNRRFRDVITQELGTIRSRRQVVGTASKGAIGGLGAALLSGGSGATLQGGWLATHALAHDSHASPTPTGTFIRPNVHSLDPAGPELTAYATAVAKMKALPIEDPRSWLYQAFIHQFPAGDFGITTFPELAAFLAEPGHEGWYTCEHHTLFFWPWHRMQLYWFEQIVRDLGEYPGFALPYWDYFDPAQRTLHQSFRIPADSSNPLWEERRDPSLNSGTSPALTPQQENSIFSNQCAGFANVDFALASESLETTPHDWVHGWIGGDFANPPSPGVMSSPSTSAQDPIFWLHHANLDRLWESWLTLGNANPTDLAWRDNDINDIGGLGLSYTFFEATGNEVTTIRVVGEVLTTTGLGYEYEELFDPAAAMCPSFNEEIVVPATPSATPSATATPESLGDNAPAEGIAVGPDPVAIPVTLEQPEAGPEAITRGGAIVLTLEGVQGQGVPGTIFEVYVNLPSDEEPDFRSVY